MPAFDQSSLLEAFRVLYFELGRSAVRAQVFVVGGAAVALAYDERRATVDVDAVFAPVAEQLGLEEDWLNDGAKSFMPGPDPHRIGV